MQGHDRGQDRRAGLSDVNPGDTPGRKHGAQALGEPFGDEVLGPGDNHGTRKYSACSGVHHPRERLLDREPMAAQDGSGQRAITVPRHGVRR